MAPFRVTALIWCGVLWFGLVWFGVVWCGLVWFGSVRFGLVWFGLVSSGNGSGNAHRDASSQLESKMGTELNA